MAIVLRGGGWLQALLAGVALSMSVLPEEFPVVLTVFPAIGAWRLARRQVLTRRLAAIEILGSTSVLCVDKTGIPRAIFPNGYDAPPGTLAASHVEPHVGKARRALAAFATIVRTTSAHCDTRLVCDAADEALARMARFADLVVASQDDPDEAMTDMALRLPDYLILNSARPGLLVPRTDPVLDLAPSALVAWDGSKESSFAVSASVPLRQRARAVTVVTLRDSGDGEAGGDPEHAELLAYLRHHGIAAQATTVAPTGAPGDALLRLASEHGHDLLVMGCYGHTRWRAICLGGASRTVLAQATIPVLMAH